MGENGTPEARSADTAQHIRLAAPGSDQAVTPDATAPASAALGAAGPPTLRSEQLRRLADAAAAALALPTPAVDHERQLPAEALARVLDAVEASTAASTKRAYRSDWDRFAGWAGRRRFPRCRRPPPSSRTASPRPPPNRPASGSGGTPRRR